MQSLYGSKPTPSEYNRRIEQIAAGEARAIEYVFDRHKVNARVDPEICVVTRQYFAFAIDALGGAVDVRQYLRYRQATGVESTRLACAVKRRWASKRTARQFARSNRWRYGPQEPYKCPICKGYHLTSLE